MFCLLTVVLTIEGLDEVEAGLVILYDENGRANAMQDLGLWARTGQSTRLQFRWLD